MILVMGIFFFFLNTYITRKCNIYKQIYAHGFTSAMGATAVF